MRPSQKQLFIKLVNHPQPSTHIVEDTIDSIFLQASRHIQVNQIQKIRPRFLTQQIMAKQQHSVDQAFKLAPNDTYIREDVQKFKVLNQSNRPFSAKFTRPSRQMTQFPTNTSIRKSNKKTLYPNSTSLKTIQGNIIQKKGTKRYLFTKQSILSKFVALDYSKQNENNKQQQSYINFLRNQKLKKQDIQKAKSRFIKQFQEEDQKYPQLNKKFTQAIGNKQLYYTKNGQTVEVNSIKRLLKKKKTAQIISPSPKSYQVKQTTKRDQEQILVAYKDKDLVFKKTYETYNMEQKPKIMFYKSQNCNYQLMD